MRRKAKTKGRSPQRSGWQWLTLGTAFAATIVCGIIGWWRPFGGRGGGEAVALAGLPDGQSAADPPFSEVRPFFQRYCFDCHSGADAEGGFAMDSVSETASVRGDRRRWQRVFQLVKVGTMPPSDVEQPTDAERQRAIDWLDRTLFYVDCQAPRDPGHVTVRRLNRSEYNYTVRDLVGVDFEPAADFPSDDVGYGFDNIGDVLTVPPLLIEKYLAAAEAIAERAILLRDPGYFQSLAKGQELRGRGEARDGDGGKVLVSRGTVFKSFTFPRRGEYLVRIEASADQGGDELAKMEVGVDGKGTKVQEVRGKRERNVYEFPLTIDAGRHAVEATFLNDFYDAESRADRNLYIHSISVEGPLGPPENLPESHRRLLAVVPGPDLSPEEAARRNLTPFIRRAFRRAVTDEDVTPYVRFVKQALDRGESFPRGMQVALQAILVSPEFLFRVETPGAAEWTGVSVPVSDRELASRLSYFLCASLPDDALLAAAEAGRLHEPEILLEQTRRLLADERADRLVANFAGQWLGLRKLATNEVAPDPALFPEFNAELRRDMWRETELFFGEIVRKDRPITDLIDSRSTFVNARLAKLYGIPGIEGDEFRRVDLQPGRRAGVATQASILTLTSYATRTSPVKRGEWVLSNLLGDAPPDPPPVVPALDETQKSNPGLSLREQLVLHRQDPTCASCHIVMDEIGFGLENFDPIGRWRDRDGDHAIDATGKLPSGETFRGPAELVAILSSRKDEFARCLTEKLLTYALGRGLEYYDRCAVNEIVDRLRANNYRFSSLVEGIVLSEPFLKRRGGAGETSR